MGGEFVHSFLRAVGFSNIASREELDKILGLVMTHPTLDKFAFTSDNDHKKIVEKSLDFSDRMGITVRGEYLSLIHISEPTRP